MTTTAEQLLERIDPATAVDRGLSWPERTAFLRDHLVGTYEGNQPVDWIRAATADGRFNGRIDAWMKMVGDTAVAYLLTTTELPEPVVREILHAAMVAEFGIGAAGLDADPWQLNGGVRRSPVERAVTAALWARGYAEALGWTPEYASAA